MKRLKDKIVYVDGSVEGYQFNKKSLGTRSFKRNVDIDEHGTATCYIPTLQRKIRIRPLVEGFDQYWEAF